MIHEPMRSKLIYKKPFTYHYELSKNGRLPVVEDVAYQLSNDLPRLLKDDLNLNNEFELRPGDVVRIESDCIADLESGCHISNAFISNLALNTTISPSIARTYFVSRDGKYGILGYGSAVKVKSIRSFEKDNFERLSADTQFIGGDNFDTEIETFGCWIVPTVEINAYSKNSSLANRKNGLLITLAIHVQITESNSLRITKTDLSDAINLLSSINWSFHPSRSILTAVPPIDHFGIKDTGLSKEEYKNSVAEVLRNIDNGSVSKVVLALRKTAHTTSAINAAALLFGVMLLNHQDDGKRYSFLFAPNGLQDDVFISISPERLSKVNGFQLETEALAGTFATKENESDNPPKNDIIIEKTDREHVTVADFIIQKLNTLKGRLSVLDRGLLTLRDVTHYRQGIHFLSHEEEVSHFKLLQWAVSNLHPTPAVCGTPTNDAKAFIRKHERFSRGLYASCCGVVSQNGGELLVGLRSALINKNRIDIFAGAGLVAGSDYESEWQEINLKMSQYLKFIDGSNKRPVMQSIHFMSATNSMNSSELSQHNQQSEHLAFNNATAAYSAVLIEELLRQGVGAFCVCPGSRSTPLVVAIHRNSLARSMATVVPDERSAGFFALGCSKAGVICAVIVTSGTAVANLLPSLCESRESLWPYIVLSADRPSESHAVGEAQTISQIRTLQPVVGWQKDFFPPDSASPIVSAQLVRSFLSDISFGVGEIVQRRHLSVHFNFQYRKNELEPETVDSFHQAFYKSLHSKAFQWMESTHPYTTHSSIQQFFFPHSPCCTRDMTQRWVEGESKYWSVIVIVGELRSHGDARAVENLCNTFLIPCICDTLSLLTRDENDSKNCIFFNVDRMLQSTLFSSTVSSSTRLIIRVGGSIISARIEEWINSLYSRGHSSTKSIGIKCVRVRDDGHTDQRHDSSWLADDYIHGSVKEFANGMTSFLQPHQIDEMTTPCPALVALRIANNMVMKSKLNEESFSEPIISKIVSEVTGDDNPLFISSSMICRDYDSFSLRNHRIGCNRGANGIDGVTSTAVGYSYGCTTPSTKCTVLIGDLAMYHDLNSLSLAASIQPGSLSQSSSSSSSGKGLQNTHNGMGQMIGKVVCVNNSGGAIFSFLRVGNYRNDFFTPFFDTPHQLNFSNIANTLVNPNAPINSMDGRMKCIRVSSADELRHALNDDSTFFIECFNLPNHEENVAIHKTLGAEIKEAIDSALVCHMKCELKWTLHLAQPNATNLKVIQSSEKVALPNLSHNPVMVLMHGWLGDELVWNQFIHEYRKIFNETYNWVQQCDILTVSNDNGDWLSASQFCYTLRDMLKNMFSPHKTPLKIIFIGYSQGGRLATHYRHLFPQDVLYIATLASAPGKDPPTFAMESSIIEMWKKTVNQTKSVNDNASYSSNVRNFLLSWYELPVFSNIYGRHPLKVEQLIKKRVGESFESISNGVIDEWVKDADDTSVLDVREMLRNMICFGWTQDAFVDLMIIGRLDSKYINLSQLALNGDKGGSVHYVRNTGHSILLELSGDSHEAQEAPSNKQDEYDIDSMQDMVKRILTSIHFKVEDESLSASMKQLKVSSDVTIQSIQSYPFSIPLNDSPLEVITNRIRRIFHARRGIRLFLHLNSSETTVIGVGEIYEPIFDLGNDITYESISKVVTQILDQLPNETFHLQPFDMIGCDRKVWSRHVSHQWIDWVQSIARKVLIANRHEVTGTLPIITYGFEQCILHVMSKLVHISLSETIAAYIGRDTMASQISMNGFGSLRSNQSQLYEKPGQSAAYNSASSVKIKGKLKLKIGGIKPDGGMEGKEGMMDAMNLVDPVQDAMRVNEYVHSMVMKQGDQMRNVKGWLRLDANRSWSIADAVAFVEHLSFETVDSIQYIEEPLTLTATNAVSLSEQYVRLFETCPKWRLIPIALDESLLATQGNTNCDVESIQNSLSTHQKNRTCVVKLSLLSLRNPILMNINKDVNVVLSCTFESGTGLTFQTIVASLFHSNIHGIHAYPIMTQNDESMTKEFENLMHSENGFEKYIILEAAEQLFESLTTQEIANFGSRNY